MKPLNYLKVENPSPIKGRSCKFVKHIVSKRDALSDLNLMKITNIHEDGTRSDQLVGLKDWVRDFHVVKPKYRKFKENKDYIDVRLCDKHRSTQAKLAMTIAKILKGVPNKNADLFMELNNPYVFNVQPSPVLLKHTFFKNYPEHQETEPYTMAAYDVETDMVNGTGEDVIMASTTFKELVYFAAVRYIYPKGWTDEQILDELDRTAVLLMGDVITSRKLKIEYELFDNQGEVVAANIAKWHEWHPDWISSWNAVYDMKANEHALTAYGYDLEQVYSDPSIEPAFRSYTFSKGRTHKTKENGEKQSLEWQEAFPTLSGSSSWQWVDEASFYAIKRAPQGKKDSYGLEFTAQDNDIDGKLYTDSCKELSPGTADWHREMQISHIFEYSIYNIKDNLTIEILDEKTNDLSLSLPQLLKSSEFYNYPSQPKCISDELSFIAMDEGYVWGARGRGTKDPFDHHKQDLKNWIALLETEKVEELGKSLFIGMESVRSRGRGLTDDIDVTGAYPTATVAANVSNKTTREEVCAIEGLDRLQFREVGVNYASSPEANALKLAQTLHRFPDLKAVEALYDRLVAEELEEVA